MQSPPTTPTTCPMCAEDIAPATTRCPHCDHEIGLSEAEPPPRVGGSRATCPVCAEDLAGDEVTCPHCDWALSPSPSASATRSREVWAAAQPIAPRPPAAQYLVPIVLTVLALVAVAVWFTGRGTTTSPTRRERSTAPTETTTARPDPMPPTPPPAQAAPTPAPTPQPATLPALQPTEDEGEPSADEVGSSRRHRRRGTRERSDHSSRTTNTPGAVPPPSAPTERAPTPPPTPPTAASVATVTTVRDEADEDESDDTNVAPHSVMMGGPCRSNEECPSHGFCSRELGGLCSARCESDEDSACVYRVCIRGQCRRPCGASPCPGARCVTEQDDSGNTARVCRR